MSSEIGVLCHITSMPNGKISDGYKFVDYLAKNNYTKWQFLPLTPPDKHGSPYASPSAFAGHYGLCSKSISTELTGEEYWIEDWALFATISAKHPGKNWTEWPKSLRDRDPEEMAKWRDKIDDEIIKQEMFQHEWLALKDYANRSNIELVGDLTYFISHHSADVWAHRELFQLDEAGLPIVVAGVPPDYFSETGQKWNLSLIHI